MGFYPMLPPCLTSRRARLCAGIALRIPNFDVQPGQLSGDRMLPANTSNFYTAPDEL